MMIPLKPEADIDALSPDLLRWTVASRLAAMVSSPRSAQAKAKPTVQFSPAICIVEDPVTGNAKWSDGRWLVQSQRIILQ